MSRDDALRRLFAGREVASAFGLLAALTVVLLALRASAVRLPGYLVFLGFEAVHASAFPGVGSASFYALFLGYLYVLAVVFSACYRLVRRRWDTVSRR